MRAYVQGMPANMVVSRYLDLDEEEDTGESALRLLLGLRDRMVQLAHLHGRAELADLLELGPGRSNRGMDRRVEALGELERLGTALPRPAHGVELWFAPALARRLRAVGIVNLAAFAALVNRKGKGWWRSVPRIGVLAAHTINRWLDQNRAVLKGADGHALLHRETGSAHPQRALPYVRGQKRVAPLEWLTAADDAGTAAARFGADLLALRGWLDGFPVGGATWLAYRKEAERLMLWCSIVANKPPSDLEDGDCDAYLAFLRNPAPAALWIGPRTSRAGTDWRPFQGPLGDASVAHAVRVLASLGTYLSRSGHVTANPWRTRAGVRRQRISHAVDPVAGMTRGVDVAPFLSWLDTVAAAPGSTRVRTALAAVAVMRMHQWRSDTLVRATVDTVRLDSDPTREESMVPAEALALRALRRHWTDRGLAWETGLDPATVLLGPPSMPETGRAKRKAERDDAPGYSVRGLHMLLTAAVARYRAEVDPTFPAMTPRDLRLAVVHDAGRSGETVAPSSGVPASGN